MKFSKSPTRHIHSPSVTKIGPLVGRSLQPKDGCIEPAPIEKPPPSQLDWTFYIALGGKEAEVWLTEYHAAGGLDLGQWTNQALALLRRRRIESARSLLALAEHHVRDRGELFPESVTHVMYRWYYSALAYYHYCTEDYDRAGEDLRLAHIAVTSAVGACTFLLPLAVHCHEFRLQDARIARTRRRWTEMWQHIEMVRAMLDDHIPLCTLSEGTPVHCRDLAHFYGPLSAYDERVRKPLLFLLEAKYRLRYFERHLHWVYTPTGFIIPY